MDHSWLRFSTKVTIRSDRFVEDCVRSLQTLTAPPNCYSRPERLRPFRGKIGSSGGWLRDSLLRHATLPSRSLKFNFIPSESGTELRGHWSLLKRIRIPVSIYLGACILGQAVELFRVVVFGAHDIWPILIGPTISFLMIYGWTWVVVALNRRRELQLVTAVTHAMESDRSAKIMGELLSLPK
jgi:hypothetical protein